MLPSAVTFRAETAEDCLKAAAPFGLGRRAAFLRPGGASGDKTGSHVAPPDQSQAALRSQRDSRPLYGQALGKCSLNYVRLSNCFDSLTARQEKPRKSRNTQKANPTAETQRTRSTQEEKSSCSVLSVSLWQKKSRRSLDSRLAGSLSPSAVRAFLGPRFSRCLITWRQTSAFRSASTVRLDQTRRFAGARRVSSGGHRRDAVPAASRRRTVHAAMRARSAYKSALLGSIWESHFRADFASLGCAARAF